MPAVDVPGKHALPAPAPAGTYVGSGDAGRKAVRAVRVINRSLRPLMASAARQYKQFEIDELVQRIPPRISLRA